MLAKMDPLTANLIWGLISAIVVTGLGALFIRHKTKAEVTDLITQAAERMLKHAAAREARLERQVQGLWAAVHALADALRRAGGDPTDILRRIEQNSHLPDFEEPEEEEEIAPRRKSRKRPSAG